MFRLFPLLMLAAPAWADTIVPVALIRAGTVVEAHHLEMVDGMAPGSISDMRDAIGLEARVNLYPHRPVRPEDLAMPTLIRRNERVIVTYVSDGLRISADGRALSRAGAGEDVRVMNLNSRTTVIGIAVAEGMVEVR
ncbi:flagellar basal body P-ring formation chaperone FlgA [Jannaschia aquimarina]|uniref:Flagella basal body P-ring formation protein FlgA n=1 Tax=Jannaschia aquimarina TaxID=935700 RepID=A0A0D1CI02_9RHOB|nr:flagellar basal body P-ring formation chaperone FlgA [Jannaschia aquimarina]KIT14297.1 flagellar basal body P-ring biosynthesis protein FlgA [Jannaschia aquimarina]SNS50298.1 flagella basal body P-ring formation protein FlgA [Jannaschia aquimarina]